MADNRFAPPPPEAVYDYLKTCILRIEARLHRASEIELPSLDEDYDFFNGVAECSREYSSPGGGCDVEITVSYDYTEDERGLLG